MSESAHQLYMLGNCLDRFVASSYNGTDTRNSSLYTLASTEASICQHLSRDTPIQHF